MKNEKRVRDHVSKFRRDYDAPRWSMCTQQAGRESGGNRRASRCCCWCTKPHDVPENYDLLQRNQITSLELAAPAWVKATIQYISVEESHRACLVPDSNPV